MDFSLSPVQQEVQTLARDILTKQVTPQHLKAVAKTGERIDRALWAELAKADLIGLALPSDVGGGGLGLLELAAVLEEVGRSACPIPLLCTVGMAALPIAEFGTDDQRKRLLTGVADGQTILSAAMEEAGAVDPLQPGTVARPDGTGWRLTGTKISVPWGPLAERILVTATTPSGAAGVFVVDPRGPGVSLARGYSTSGDLAGTLEMTDAEVTSDDVLGDTTNSTVAEWMYEHALAASLAMAVGVLDRDLELTASYTSERVVFGRPIATFQGAALRLADGYIDMEAIRVSAWSAIWRLSEGLSASDQLAIAKFWMAEGGQRIVHTGQHLHGGVGVDTDYPLHRYFLRAKELEMQLGGVPQQLLRLGKSTLGKN